MDDEEFVEWCIRRLAEYDALPSASSAVDSAVIPAVPLSEVKNAIGPSKAGTDRPEETSGFSPSQASPEKDG